jgi:hypothetical protein
LAKKPETVFRERFERELKKLEPDLASEAIQQKAKKGTGDRLVCALGQFIWLEFKSEDGKEMAIQEYKRKKFERAGAITFVVEPANAPDVLREIQAVLAYNREKRK